MILYYAVGGGLGHINRALAFCETKHLQQFKILSAHSLAPQLIPRDQLICVPESLAKAPLTYQKWLQNLLHQHAIRTIILDSFPLGILGEWIPFYKSPQLQFQYIARLLKMEAYSNILADHTPIFQKTWVVEKLYPEHQKWVKTQSLEVHFLPLRFPSCVPKKLPRKKKCKNWLIVHSEPLSEIMALYAYAQQMATQLQISPQYIFISPTPIPDLPLNALHFFEFPACTYFESADRIFTGAGFNSVYQYPLDKTKHHLVPFFRKYDDQFERIKQLNIKSILFSLK